jgi:hypothetical protein
VKTTLDISKSSALLQWLEVEHSSALGIFSSILGNTVRKYVFSAWAIDPGGLYFPTKWKVIINGLEEGQQSLYNVKLNPEISASTFEVPQEFKGSFEKILSTSPAELAKPNHGDGDHLDIAEGVVMTPGKQFAYNSLIIKENKEIVIVEAPYSNANSEYVIQYARKLFPDIPITSVVSTNQLWFHLAGLTPYTKIHAPIYVLDSNVDLVRQNLSAQGAGPVSAAAQQLRAVRNRTQIGVGTNRIVLIPFRGSASARMMAVYFPELKLLYSSDMYLPQAWGGPRWTEHLAEIRDMINREHIDVERVAGVSMPPHDWKELLNSIPGGAADSAPVAKAGVN